MKVGVEEGEKERRFLNRPISGKMFKNRKKQGRDSLEKKSERDCSKKLGIKVNQNKNKVGNENGKKTSSCDVTRRHVTTSTTRCQRINPASVVYGRQRPCR